MSESEGPYQVEFLGAAWGLSGGPSNLAASATFRTYTEAKFAAMLINSVHAAALALAEKEAGK